MIAMVLAAGRGARLRPLTDKTPKSLVEIDGVSLLERHLSRLSAAGIRDVVINLGWLGEQIVERVGSGTNLGLNVVYSDERNDVLETGGGIHRALPMLGEASFLVVNADVFTDMPLPKGRLAGNDLGHLMLVKTPHYLLQSDFNLVGDRVTNDTKPELTFSGIAIYRPDLFADCAPGRFSVVPLLRQAANEQRLGGTFFDGMWADVGTPERLSAVRDEVF